MSDKPENQINDDLLGKFLAGETDAEELQQVRQWLANNQAGQEELGRFERIWETAGQLPDRAPVDTDAAWMKVRSNMSLAAPSTTEWPSNESRTSPYPIEKPLPTRSRTEKHWTSWMRYWQVAAIILLVLGGFGIVYQQLQEKPVAQLAASATNQKVEKTLPDGTKVLLNRNSKLSYPEVFTGDQREVTLLGEAFFDVVPDPSKPFLIHAQNTTVQVLGTSFSVRAYDQCVRVAVKTGKVKFSVRNKAITLTKDEQASYQPIVDSIRKDIKLNPNLLAFKTGRLSFREERLDEIVKTLNEVYGANIQLARARLRGCAYTSDFDHWETLDEVLEVVADGLGLTIQREGNRIILDGSGTGCPN